MNMLGSGVGFLSIPAIVLISDSSLDWHIKLLLVLCLLLGGLLIFFGKREQSIFIRTGKETVATSAQELILTKPGGKGSSYFCDPSVAFGSLTDFKYTVGKCIDFRQLLKEKSDVIGPYCVDDEHRQIVFVETKPGFDPAETGPFYFQSQRDNAIRLYTVPYEEYHAVIESLDQEMTRTDNLLLVYNTSRCGSTLLSKCLDSLTSMQSISEPDIFSSLTHMASEAYGTRNKDIIKLARSHAKLLVYLRRKRHPDRTAICFKFRFQCVYAADLFQQAIPDAKAIFLYRNGLDVIDSMGAAFINTGLYRFIRAISLDSLYVYHASSLPEHLWKLMPLMKDTTRFPVSCYKWLGAVSPFVMTWISVMHKAMEAYNAGIICEMIRYEDLITGKTELVRQMLLKTGISVSVETSSKSIDVFKKDSHANTTTKSRRNLMNTSTGKMSRKGFVYLKDKDVVAIKDVILRHEIIGSPDFIIPGTLTLENCESPKIAQNMSKPATSAV